MALAPASAEIACEVFAVRQCRTRAAAYLSTVKG
jgi:hypothetical protein